MAGEQAGGGVAEHHETDVVPGAASQIEAVRRGRPTLERQAAGQAGESKMLRVRVTPGMDAALVELSRQRGTTKSEVVRELLAERLSPAS